MDIALIKLPHMANFDDFDPLARRPGVAVRYIESAAGLGCPDLVILPGTKTTRADLAYLRERGLDRAIVAFAQAGGAVLGGIIDGTVGAILGGILGAVLGFAAAARARSGS